MSGYYSGYYPERSPVPLPNDKWIRSTKKPNWALCLDKENRMYGWKMYELNGGWVSGSALSMSEVEIALQSDSLQVHRELFEGLKTHLESLVR